jgi:protein-L-isoaspartate(D-aspartate) O-methyltransferase
VSRFDRNRTDYQSSDERREEMVQRTIADRGVRDPRVLVAMRTVRRERFIDPSLRDSAYDDSPLPIEKGQTISQPFIVALMAEQARIEPDDRVLEVGTGSGYGAAVLGCIAAEVWTIERHAELVAQAARVLNAEGFDNVHVVEGDGTLGWPDAAPFDAIVVTAGAPDPPDALCRQLVDGGRLVIPVGQSRHSQELLRITRRGDSFQTEDLAAVRFVPLVGDEGW